MEYPLISIIVPIYNVEKYLIRCIESLLSQTYPNIEILLINDGSPDNSWQICQKYAHCYKNIKAFTKENGGLSSTRNFGLRYAKGKYIGFIDSDDWISPNMYSYLYSLIKNYNAEISQIEYELAYNDCHQFSKKEEVIDVIHNSDKILEYYMEKTTISGDYSVCICLIKSDIAKKFRFREGKTVEDMDYKFNILSACSCFVSSNLPMYHYFQAGNSISSGKLVRKNFELYESAEILYQLCLKQQSPRTKFLGKVKKARTAFSLLAKAAFYGISDEIDDQSIRKLVKENRSNLPILLKAPVPISRKLIALGFAFNYNISKKLISIYKKVSRGRI